MKALLLLKRRLETQNMAYSLHILFLWGSTIMIANVVSVPLNDNLCMWTALRSKLLAYPHFRWEHLVEFWFDAVGTVVKVSFNETVARLPLSHA